MYISTALRTINSFAAVFRTPLRASRSLVTSCTLAPDQVSPAIVTQLTGHRSPWLATLVDLAQRGVVYLEPETPATSRSRLRHRAANDQSLTRYEQLLLQAIFSADDDRVALSSVAPRVTWQARQLEEALEGELRALGWLDPNRQRQREQRLAVSVLSTLIGVMFLIVGVVLGASGQTSALGLGLGVVLGGCGIVALAVGAVAFGLGTAFSALSEQGELAAARWQGYTLFLKQVFAGTQPPPEHFETDLALTVALGLASNLVRSSSLPHVASLPPWFKALARLREAGDWGAPLALLTVAEPPLSEALPGEREH